MSKRKIFIDDGLFCGYITMKDEKDTENIELYIGDCEECISEETFIQLSLLAHERDITLNQLCNEILKERIKEVEKQECPHEDTRSTAQWGFVCKTCGQMNIVKGEDKE